MACEPLVQGPLFGAPVSRLAFDQREFVKTPTPSPESSPEKEEANRVDRDLAALDIHGEPSKTVEKTGAGDKAKPVDFFDLLDMLGDEEMDLGDLPGDRKAKPAAVMLKHPVGCRQRNVARHKVCPSLNREDTDDPFLSKGRAVLKEMVAKDQARRERERLEYLKNAR